MYYFPFIIYLLSDCCHDPGENKHPALYLQTIIKGAANIRSPYRHILPGHRNMLLYRISKDDYQVFLNE